MWNFSNIMLFLIEKVLTEETQLHLDCAVILLQSSKDESFILSALSTNIHPYIFLLEFKYSS